MIMGVFLSSSSSFILTGGRARVFGNFLWVWLHWCSYCALELTNLKSWNLGTVIKLQYQCLKIQKFPNFEVKVLLGLIYQTAQWAEYWGEEDITFTHLKIDFIDQSVSISPCINLIYTEYQLTIRNEAFKLVHYIHKLSLLEYNNVSKTVT